MRDGFRMVARIPYPATVPKYFAVTSEVATLAYLRSAGVPTPEVYRYSPTPDNAAGTEYILMQYIEGVNLADVLSDLEDENVTSILRKLVQLKSDMLSMVFPAGGSLYFAEDLANVPGSPSGLTKPSIALKDKRFCIGPEASLPLWFGRRSQLDVDRGPCRPLTYLLISSLQLMNRCRRNFRRSPHQRSGKGTSLLTAVRSTAVAFPAHQEGSL